jgi:hypothetical protein
VAELDTYYSPIDKATKEEWRYTYGPLYSPNRKDAHNEWVEADTLHKACIAFMQSRFDSGDNRLTLQHGDLGKNRSVGNIVEMNAWPYDHTIMLKQADGTEVKQDMPAGTVYAGVIWDADAWPLVKNGRIGGLSMGGRAVRVKGGDGATMMHMGHKIAKSLDAVRKSAIGDAWLKANEPLIDAMLGINARLDVLDDVQKAKRIPHAYVGSANGMCAHCGKQKSDPAHGEQDPETPVNGGFGDTDGDVSTARLPWVHVS